MQQLNLSPYLFLLHDSSQELPKQSALRSPEFQMVALLGGLLGLGISFTSLW